MYVYIYIYIFGVWYSYIYMYVCTYFYLLVCSISHSPSATEVSHWENVLDIQCFWLCMLHQQRVLKPNSLTTKQSVFAATIFWPAVSTHFGVAELGDPIACFEITAGHRWGLKKKTLPNTDGDFGSWQTVWISKTTAYIVLLPQWSSPWFHSRTAAQIHPWLQCGSKTCSPGLRRNMLQGLLNCPKPYTML